MSEPRGVPGVVADAVVELMVGRGYSELTAAAVAERAGIDQAKFDRLFADLEDCVLCVYWLHTDSFTDVVFGAYEEGERWRDGLRLAAYAAARWIRDNPAIVRFGTVEMFGAGLMAQAQRESHLHRMVDLIDAGRQELDDPDSVSRGVAESVFGSIYEFLVRELQKEGGGTRAAESFVPDLMYLAVRPYLGHEVAREELSIPAPPELHRRTEKRHEVQEGEVAGYGPGVSKGERQDAGALRLARLPPGRHGLSREFVTQNQRDRLAAGTIAVVAEKGLHETTISQISAAAGVSRRTFYTYFSSKEECFLAAYATIVEHLKIATDEAAEDAPDWAGAVAAKLKATLEFFDANPDLARFCLIAPQRAGEEIAGRYRDAMDQAVAYLCEGMPPPPATKAPSPAIAASLIGGMVALIVRQLEDDDDAPLLALQPDLLEVFLAPYLGRKAATKIAQRST
jgi:AcrR family transcriptional regulator